jgi:hypothetical protein
MYEAVDVESVKAACKEVFAQPSVFASVWEKHK